MKTLNNMNILVVGASRGTGLAAVRHLLEAGSTVTAFARRAEEIDVEHSRLRKLNGDALNFEDVRAAVAGQDAVIVTLGIAENPLTVRAFGAKSHANDVRSQGTRNVISAMEQEGIRRLVVQTTYGVGETRDKLGLMDRLFFSLLLKPQIADTEIQERDVQGSGLDWVVAQPVHLTDTKTGRAFTSLDGTTQKMKVSREEVARVLAAAANDDSYVRQSVSISSVGI